METYKELVFSVAKATLQSQMFIRLSVHLSSKPPSTWILHLSTFVLHLPTFILHLSTFIIHLSTFILHFATFKLFSLFYCRETLEKKREEEEITLQTSSSEKVWSGETMINVIISGLWEGNTNKQMIYLCPWILSYFTHIG